MYTDVCCHYRCFFSLFSFYVSSPDGQLRHIKTGEPFVFNAREDLHRWNQKRYEALGEVTDCFFYWSTKRQYDFFFSFLFPQHYKMLQGLLILFFFFFSEYKKTWHINPCHTENLQYFYFYICGRYIWFYSLTHTIDPPYRSICFFLQIGLQIWHPFLFYTVQQKHHKEPLV